MRTIEGKIPLVSPSDLGRAFTKFSKVAIAAVTGVYLLAIAREILLIGFGRDHLFGFGPRISAAFEGTLPAWFTSAVLIVCAVVLFFIAHLTSSRGGGFVRHWYVLAAGFVYLSADEAVRLHEMIAPISFKILKVPNAWAVVGIMAALLIGLYFVGFLRHLPRRFALLFMTAGACYVGGGGGVELITGVIEGSGLRGRAMFASLMLLEEILEAGGATLFLFGLSAYVRTMITGSAADDISMHQDPSLDPARPRVA